MLESSSGYFDGFAWAVPVAFGLPLEYCRFEEGDTLYDTRGAYAGTWAEAAPGPRATTWCSRRTG